MMIWDRRDLEQEDTVELHLCSSCGDEFVDRVCEVINELREENGGNGHRVLS